MAETPDETSSTSRRAVLAGVGAAGVVAALAGCGSSGGNNAGSGGGSPAAAATGGATGGSGADGALAKTGDIPVGGGKIFDQQNVVVTQPTSGNFKAFSATCTHMGCMVNSVANGVIQCPCHGSQYSITDGSVKSGPAPKPLPAKNVTVQGDQLTVS
jgi:Rieske Fe-S protein